MRQRQLLHGAITSNKWLFTFFILEILTFFGITLTIPSDPTNAVFLGFSLSRWLILAVFLVLFVAMVYALVFHKKAAILLAAFFNSPIYVRMQAWVCLLLASMLWLVIWFPATRITSWKEEVVRLRPLALTVLLILLELVIYFWFVLQSKQLHDLFARIRENKKTIAWVFVTVGGVSVIFILLKIFSSSTLSSTYIYSSGPFISPMQLFFGLVIFCIVFLATYRLEQFRLKTPILAGILVMIGLTAFVVWNFTPLTCADDRPGPYPPNNICYPQVDDSVYSIGSHYITLGKGVLNHWFTEKPFYLVFLAAGQWLLGEDIDTYLIFQIALMTMIPVFLFLIARKLSGLVGGLLAAYLSIVLGANNILYYATAGGINVKIENTEILTGFLILVSSFLMIKYLSRNQVWPLLLLSGGMLGLASLTRINPVFILPVLLVFFLIIRWKKWRKFFSVSVIFLIGFLIVFTPGILAARDTNGDFYYIQKIENVFDNRYQPDTTTEKMRVPIEFAKDDETRIAGAVNSVQLVTYRPGDSDLELAPAPVYARLVKDSLSQEVPLENEPGAGKLINRGRAIILTTANNLYLSLARLPIHFSLHSFEQILKLPTGVTGYKVPVWHMPLSPENLIVLILNLLFVISGIYFSVHKWKWAGFVPLLMQFGYHLGNGAALTSGERYLEPVQWVTLLYYSIGIFALASFIFKGIQPDRATGQTLGDIEPKKPFKQLIKQGWRAVLLLIFVGMIIPLVNTIPNQINARTTSSLQSIVKESIAGREKYSGLNLAKFLEADNAIIVEGIAYHPRQYKSPLRSQTDDVFELTVLGEDKVYVSNYLANKPDLFFSDGSRVILLGCVIREKTFWGVESVLIKTLGIVQLDHEKHIYFTNPGAFACDKAQLP